MTDIPIMAKCPVCNESRQIGYIDDSIYDPNFSDQMCELPCEKHSSDWQKMIRASSLIPIRGME